MSEIQESIQAESKIAELRKKAELSQLDLSLLLGVAVSTVQNWENGRAGVEQIERVVRLCQILECRAEDLIEYKKVPVTEIVETKRQTKRKEKLAKRQKLFSIDNLSSSSSTNN